MQKYNSVMRGGVEREYVIRERHGNKQDENAIQNVPVSLKGKPQLRGFYNMRQRQRAKYFNIDYCYLLIHIEDASAPGSG
jgi:hypothetical protein